MFTVHAPRVATIAPMKRGLKEDEISEWAVAWDKVATIAPMKRGLKVEVFHLTGHEIRGSNHCPDEKGTES